MTESKKDTDITPSPSNVDADEKILAAIENLRDFPRLKHYNDQQLQFLALIMKMTPGGTLRKKAFIKFSNDWQGRSQQEDADNSFVFLGSKAFLDNATGLEWDRIIYLFMNVIESVKDHLDDRDASQDEQAEILPEFYESLYNMLVRKSRFPPTSNW